MGTERQEGQGSRDLLSTGRLENEGEVFQGLPSWRKRVGACSESQTCCSSAGPWSPLRSGPNLIAQETEAETEVTNLARFLT